METLAVPREIDKLCGRVRLVFLQRRKRLMELSKWRNARFPVYSSARFERRCAKFHESKIYY